MSTLTKSRGGSRGGQSPRKPKARAATLDVLDALPSQAVIRMAESVAQARSADEALRDHLAIAQDLGGARLVFVSMFDLAQGVLAVVAVRGRADETVVATKLGEGPIGQAFVKHAIVGQGTGHLAVPLFEGDKPTGVLSVVGARLEATAEVWQAIASHLVAAQKAAQARDAAVRRNRDLETAVAGLRSLERARDELLGNVSHELKSPLTTIKAYLAMARKERLGELTEKQKRAFEVCDRNADRLLRLINDMLLTTRLQAGRMSLADRPIALRALAQAALETLAPLAAANHINLGVERGGEVYIKGDRERLLEAVVHLVENGVVYNHAGGEVSVRIYASGGVACLEVKDSGSGIPPEDLSHIFERFYRGQGTGARAGSSGLGLAIVRQVVQLHGGTALASSAPGEGSTFLLRFPLFAGAVSLDAESSEPCDGAILVVEDDEDCREVLEQVLESEGMRVMGAADSESAIKILSASRPALVLLDLRLGGSDGRLVLQHLRFDPRLARTPVFVISGDVDSAAGFRYDGPEHIDGFFEKPLNLQRLLGRIQEVVRPLAQAVSP